MRRYRLGHDSDMSVVDHCGLLDVDDVRATISTCPIPADETRAALMAATRSAAFDGPALSGPHDAAVFAGVLTIAKAQHREHERLATAHWFDEIRATVGVPAPKLLDSGTVSTAGGPRWWLVLSHMPGIEKAAPDAQRQRQLGHWLRSWHEQAPARGLRLDSPGGLGAFLGTPRAAFPETYPAIAEALAQVCQGMAMTPIHGDVAVGHNTLCTGDELTAILDPGVVHVGPRPCSTWPGRWRSTCPMERILRRFSMATATMPSTPMRWTRCCHTCCCADSSTRSSPDTTTTCGGWPTSCTAARRACWSYLALLPVSAELCQPRRAARIGRSAVWPCCAVSSELSGLQAQELRVGCGNEPVGNVCRGGQARGQIRLVGACVEPVQAIEQRQDVAAVQQLWFPVLVAWNRRVRKRRFDHNDTWTPGP